MDSIEFLHEYENEFPEAPISNVPPGISFSKLDEDEQELRAEEIYPLVKLLEKLQVCCKKRHRVKNYAGFFALLVT